MSDSETSSSDVKVKYQNSNGDNLLEDKSNDKKQQTTDTDYYFNLIANPSKIISKKEQESESSDLNNILKETDSSSDSSKSSRSSSSSSSSSDSSRKSSKSNSESRSKYDRISVSPKGSRNDSPKQPVIPGFKSSGQTNTANTANTSNNTNTAEIKPAEEPKPLTPQEIRMKKIELLRKLCEIKAKGFELSKDYDFNSSLEEMEYEYELLRSFVDKRNGVKIFKSGLLQAVSVIEFLNDKYDPFDFHLSGWGEHMSVEVDSWEDVLEEIYEKYKGTGKKMAPEIKLLYLIIASASAFHFSKSHASTLPGLDTVLASNPGLLSKIMNPGKGESSQFMTPQELNIERQKELLKKKDNETKQTQQSQQAQQAQQKYIEQLQAQLQRQNDMINQQQNMINKQNSEPQAANAKPPVLPPTIPVGQLKPNVPDIRAPSQVKDILNRLHNLQPSTIKPSITETQDETSSNNERLVSETTLSESNPRKKAAQKKPAKKSNISIF